MNGSKFRTAFVLLYLETEPAEIFCQQEPHIGFVIDYQ